MRILLLSDFGPPVRGGLESHVEALATELANSGHEVHLGTIAECALADHRITLHRIKTTASSLVTYADPSRPFSIPLRDPGAHRAIAGLVDLIRPDIVHAHSWLAASAPRRAGVPLVMTAHDYSLICQLKTLLRPAGTHCEGPALVKCVGCGRGSSSLARSALLTSATSIGRSRLNPDAVIAVSGHVADRLRPYVGSNLHVIPNFVDLSALEADTEENPAPASTPFAIFAGDPSRHKGFDDLLDIWSSASAPAAGLLVATTRPVSRVLPAGVRTRQLSRPQLFGELKRARLLVVPSLWEDPCPTVVLEAFCAGTPVVAYASGGVPELIDDGVQGLLVPTGDVSALRDALELVLADDDLAEALGSGARTAAAQYVVQVGAKRTIAIYESVLDSRK